MCIPTRKGEIKKTVLSKSGDNTEQLEPSYISGGIIKARQTHALFQPQHFTLVSIWREMNTYGHQQTCAKTSLAAFVHDSLKQ